ncbi:MAG: hypothetical protein K1X83_06050 [Oligoflexia bacterium]|nr:hypothetical protein [Oligoflexia bacterium]
MLMVLVFVLPLWEIGLKAPQYPEGLALQIWVNKVSGDVRNINILNHYIGMAKIEQDKIPELRMFPLAFGVLIGLGILSAIINRRSLILVWCCATILFAVAGLYDFYSWEYRYGHELSEDAPMKLEDSYQPPLIGTKQLANITASSWPSGGGYAFTAAALIALSIAGFTLLGAIRRKA